MMCRHAAHLVVHPDSPSRPCIDASTNAILHCNAACIFYNLMKHNQAHCAINPPQINVPTNAKPTHMAGMKTALLATAAHRLRLTHLSTGRLSSTTDVAIDA